jgi:hypothetical protein
MIELPVCPECGVPRQITEQHTWMSSGAIVETKDPETRLVCVESDNIDSLIEGIGGLIGMPVEPIILNATRKATRAYMSALIPDEAKEMAYEGLLDITPIGAILTLVAGLMGYGQLTLEEARYERDDADYTIASCREPYSLPLIEGNLAGTIEALIDAEVGVSHTMVSEGVYELRTFMARHTSVMKEKIKLKSYQHGGGDIELRRCSTCGGPAALADFHWDLERGLINLGPAGRRVCMLGPTVIDPLFEELERMLGGDIQEVVVEAQRRFVRSGFYSLAEVQPEQQMREVFALRGLGDVRELRFGRNGGRLRLENAAMHLMVVGLGQGLYEVAFGKESRAEWELSGDGTLEVKVTPWK